MSNYTKTTNFATKDALASGNPAKIVKGTEIDTEFNNIAVASGTKADKASPVFTGTVTLPVTNADSLSIGGDGVTVTGIKDEDDMASNSATKLASQQSIKAYVDSQVTAQDLDVTDGTTSISIDLDSEALSLLGGTGVTSTASGNGVTMAIDATVATLSGSQTLTNKTLATPAVTGALTTDGTIDGRDVAVDGTKLDTVETNADVTDTTNVTAAGALMDSEVTNLTQVKAFDSTDYATAAQGTTADAALPKAGGAMTGAITTNSTFDGRDVATDGTKLDGIEALADVTDATNVTAAGALMDSELTSIASVKALNQGVATTDSPTFVGLTTSGEITANGGIALGDNDRIKLGDGPDLQIWHNGSDSYVMDSGTGNLKLLGSDAVEIQSQADNSNMIVATAGGAVTLYNANAPKLATTSTGIDVTGTATMDGLTVSASQAGGVTAQIQNSNSTQTGGSRLDFLFSGSTVTGRIQNRFNGADFQTDWYTGNDGLEIFTDLAKTEKRLDIASNGDLSLYEDTGTTAKFFWDSSAESLGIGTDSPDAKIEIVGSGTTVKVSNASVSSTNTAIQLGGYAASTSSAYGAHIRTYHDFGVSGASSLAFETSGSQERMRIDSSGNVGIGTTSPPHNLSVNSSSTGIISVGDFTGDNVKTYIEADQTNNVAKINSRNNHPLAFSVNNTERMRIDSSGNLLVGKTSNSIDTVGGLIRANGQIGGCADGNYAGVFSRNTSDGSIVLFRKESTTVGSIGVALSDNLYFSGVDAGLGCGTGTIYPAATYGQASDNDTDLGTSSTRFKNLYLSGGVYLGGTGAANKLDDYEEGTWTATIADASTGGNTGSTHTGRYRKVGTLVTVFCSLTNIDTTGLTAVNVLYVQGLPFTSNASNNSVGTCKVDTVDLSSRTYIYANMGGNDSWLNFQTAGSNIGESNIDPQHITSGTSDIEFTIQYIV